VTLAKISAIACRAMRQAMAEEEGRLSVIHFRYGEL